MKTLKTTLSPQKVPKHLMKAVIAVVLGAILALVGIVSMAWGHTFDLKLPCLYVANGSVYTIPELTLGNVPNGNSATVSYHIGTSTFHNHWNKDTWPGGWTTVLTDVPKSDPTPDWPGTLQLPYTGSDSVWLYVMTQWSPDGFIAYSDNQVKGLPGSCSQDSPTATAGVTVHPATCSAPGSAEVSGLVHASLVGTLDQSVGTHSAQFKADSGYVFADNSKTKTVSYTLPDKNKSLCATPTLSGSTAVGVCTAGAPYIGFVVSMTDPDGQATSHEAHLLLSDGQGNSADILLGSLTDQGSGVWSLSGKALWPGATVAGDGVTPTGWPGWEEVGGVWQQTTGNFAWVRLVNSAVISVNPETTVALSYPDVTPDCSMKPTLVVPVFPKTEATCKADATVPTLSGGMGYTLAWKNNTPTGPGSYTAVATATGTNMFQGGKTTLEQVIDIGKKLTGPQCGLAYTGINNPVPWLLGGGGLLLFGAGLMVFYTIRRKQLAK